MVVVVGKMEVYVSRCNAPSLACEEGALEIFIVGDVSGCCELQKGGCRRSTIVAALAILWEVGVSCHNSSR